MLKKLVMIGAAFLLLPLGALPADAVAMHYILKGDSLFKIAVRNDTTVKVLKQANGIQGDMIYAGEKLAVPSENTESPATSTQKPWSFPCTSREKELLARLITAEAGAEPFKGKVAVVAVILNRMGDGRFPKTIAGNIFKPHEFESVSNGLIWEQPHDDAYKAVEVALRGWDPTNGAKFFFNPAKVRGGSWVWTRTIIDRIGGHVFAI